MNAQYHRVSGSWLWGPIANQFEATEKRIGQIEAMASRTRCKIDAFRMSKVLIQDVADTPDDAVGSLRHFSKAV
jgi:hypothetical protein